jgi:CII-binding regulator of phage lambda lysogenization HflD
MPVTLSSVLNQMGFLGLQTSTNNSKLQSNVKTALFDRFFDSNSTQKGLLYSFLPISNTLGKTAYPNNQTLVEYIKSLNYSLNQINTLADQLSKVLGNLFSNQISIIKQRESIYPGKQNEPADINEKQQMLIAILTDSLECDSNFKTA